MNEAKLACVEHQPWRWEQGTPVLTDVNSLPYQGESGFGEVNSYLMGAPCLQSAIQECSVPPVTQGSYVSNCELTLACCCCRSAEPVPSILDQPRAEGVRLLDMPVDQGAVAPVRGVLPELLCQVLLRCQCQREHQ